MTKIPQIRITVNSRCGRACFYCRPSGEALATGSGVEIGLENLLKVTSAFVRQGATHIKLTGGDPALWDDLVEAVSLLKEKVGVTDLHVISRHPKIGDLADLLANAGADLINLSIDTLDDETHRKITGIDDLPDLLKSLKYCVASGIPCKVNTVVMKGVNDQELDNLIDFCGKVGVKTLKLLDVIDDLHTGDENYGRRLKVIGASSLDDLYLPLGEIAQSLKLRATNIHTVYQGGLGHPMLSLTLSTGLEVLIKDHQAGAWYGSVCQGCSHFPCHDALMSIRVTSDLRLQFCLLRGDVAIDLKPYLDGDQAELDTIIAKALDIYATAYFLKSETANNSEILSVV
ncbi:molybdenum cofactor biosynthesis protein A (plasmid) [Calothrix sp. NIES-4101]|nr:molybdenum cofactor biosynthesis protein A [Calothrix sp. NIES-4101]